MNYLKRLWQAAKTKLTVYAAVITTSVAMVPQLISDYWGQAETAIPHLQVYHGVVVGFGLLLTIWARVRRELHPPTPVP